MKACFHCGKTAVFGRRHTHHRGVAGGRWKKRAQKTRRIFRPNLHKIEILEKGKTKKVLLCTKCLKRIRKDINEGKKPFLQLSKKTLTILTPAKLKTQLKKSEEKKESKRTIKENENKEPEKNKKEK